MSFLVVTLLSFLLGCSLIDAFTSITNNADIIATSSVFLNMKHNSVSTTGIKSLRIPYNFLSVSLNMVSENESNDTGVGDEETNEDESNESDSDEEREILGSLPSAGNLSYSGEGEDRNTGDSDLSIEFVSRKFELQYTCKICDTRNSHMISRRAYRKGVVIVVCKECKSKHIIADNLGLYQISGFDKGSNIEEYMRANGRENDISRVTKEISSLDEIMSKESRNKEDDCD